MTFISNKLYTEAMKEELVMAESMKEVTQIFTHPSAKQLHPLKSGFPIPCICYPPQLCTLFLPLQCIRRVGE